MIIDFPVETDAYAEYCMLCHAHAGFTQQSDTLGGGFVCDACGQLSERKLIIDPRLRWWIDDAGNYCHESVGAALFDDRGRLLLFQLTKFPFGSTVPAGHVDVGEEPIQAVTREVREEVELDIPASELQLIVQTVIDPDSCRRGSDRHNWSLFGAHIGADQISQMRIDAKEGKASQWVEVSRVRSLRLPAAMRYLVEHHEQAIQSYAANQK